MNEYLNQFIINRIVSDYVRLREKGIAPEIEQYAIFWPDRPSELLTPLFLEEFRYRWSRGETIRTETFLAEYPAQADNVPLLLQILEQELRNAPDDPDAAAVRARFPRLSDEQINHLVRQVLFFRVWNPPTTPAPKPAARKSSTQETEQFSKPGDTDVADESGATISKDGENDLSEKGTASLGKEGTAVYEPPAVMPEPEVEGTAVYEPPAATSEPEEEGTAVYELPAATSEPEEEGTAVYELPVATPEPEEEGTAVFEPPESARKITLKKTPTTSNWGEGKAPSINWTDEEIASSLDVAQAHYEEVLKESSTAEGPVAPTKKSPSRSAEEFPDKAKLKRNEEFTVRDTLVVEDYVGSGAWKDVYKARQKSTRQLVALKHLREKNEKECESLIREVRTQAQLTHQNIPPVFEFDLLDNGQAIVVEKLVDGSRWSDSMASRTLEDNLRILLEVGQAIAYAHRRHQLIHRDLKPDNVVINDAFDEVYVIDWGLAVSIAPEPPEPRDNCVHISEVTGIAGTPLYWAPEMARGEAEKCSARSDVFLLGALLYEILTQHPPYEVFSGSTTLKASVTVRNEPPPVEVGPMLRSVRGVVFPPKTRSPERFIPDELAMIAMKAMAPEPEDRYVDAGEFVEAIKRYQHHAEATLRCDAAWRSYRAVAKEIGAIGEKNEGLHPLTLRLIELSDTFYQVFLALKGEEDGADFSDSAGIGDDPLRPAIRSALSGEIESRRKLFDLTLRTGDLTLAAAQLELMERNPLGLPEEIRGNRRRIDRMYAARRRAKTMKWVAVALLVAFLGSSVLYGHLINEQFKKTEMQRRRAEANFQKTREAVMKYYTTVAKDKTLRNEGLIPLRRELLDSAKDYYEDFVAEKSNDPDVVADQMNSLFDMGYVDAIIGNLNDAIGYYRRALELGGTLMRIAPNHVKGLNSMAKIHKDLGVAYKAAGETAKVLPEYEESLRISRQLAEREKNDPVALRDLARILHNLGDYYADEGNRSLSKLDQLRAQKQKLAESREDAERLKNTSAEKEGMTEAEWEELNNFIREDISELEKAIAESPGEEQCRAHAEADFQKAGPYYQDSLEIRREMLRLSDPPEFAFGSSQTRLALAQIELKKSRIAGFDGAARSHRAAAQRELEAALQLMDRLKVDEEKKEREAKDEGKRVETNYGINEKFLHGIVFMEDGLLKREEEKLPESIGSLEKSRMLFREITQTAPDNVVYQVRLDDVSIALYEAFSLQGRSEDVLKLCEERVRECWELMRMFPEIFNYIAYWGSWILRDAETFVLLDRVKEAASRLETGIAYLSDERNLPVDGWPEAIETILYEMTDALEKAKDPAEKADRDSP